MPDFILYNLKSYNKTVNKQIKLKKKISASNNPMNKLTQRENHSPENPVTKQNLKCNRLQSPMTSFDPSLARTNNPPVTPFTLSSLF